MHFFTGTYKFLLFQSSLGMKKMTGRGKEEFYQLVHIRLNVPFSLALVVADHGTGRHGVMCFHLLFGCLPRHDIRGQWQAPRLLMKCSSCL